jgi:hypothetical protein
MRLEESDRFQETPNGDDGGAWRAGMFSHVSMGTGDLERAGHFYDAVLSSFGLKPPALQK